jgi:hypothetical protein
MGVLHPIFWTRGHLPPVGYSPWSPNGKMLHPLWAPGASHAAADAIPNYVNTGPLTRVHVLTFSTKVQTVDLRRREDIVPP